MPEIYKRSTSILILLACCFCIANAQNMDGANTVYSKEGRIIFSDGHNSKTISTTANDTLPLLHGGDIYYVSNPDDNKGTIFVYNISSGRTQDLLRTAANDKDYPFKEKIANMLLDANAGRLYFSTVSISAKGTHDYLSWIYDLGTKKLRMYKDGVIVSIDPQGNQVIVFYGLDYKGSYSMKNIYTTDGSVFESYAKEYNAGYLK